MYMSELTPLKEHSTFAIMITLMTRADFVLVHRSAYKYIQIIFMYVYIILLPSICRFSSARCKPFLLENISIHIYIYCIYSCVSRHVWRSMFYAVVSSFVWHRIFYIRTTIVTSARSLALLMILLRVKGIAAPLNFFHL